jgi:type VI secretion system Hcp family effector
MAFNAYLVFDSDSGVKGESTSQVAANKEVGAIEVTDFGFGVSMPVTGSRSDGGGATVGRANFDVFTANKNIDTATCKLVELCCKGTAINKILLHLYRQGESEGEGKDTGVVKYAMIVFGSCVITKVGISGGGEELPKESLEFNYGICEYQYHLTDHDTGKRIGGPMRAGWSTLKNKFITTNHDFDKWEASKADWKGV